MPTELSSGKYRKMHIPDDPLYYEKFYFTPGDLGFPNFDTKYARIGVQICWDQWYPEGSRLTAMSGAQVIFYPTEYRVASARKSAERRGTTGCLENHSAQPRDCQRRICCGGESRGIRRRSGQRRLRAGILGKFFCGRSVWRNYFASRGRPRRNSGSGMRPGKERRHAAKLAVSARPAHRRLPADSESLARGIMPQRAVALTISELPPILNIACPRNGSLTRAPGWAGHTK